MVCRNNIGSFNLEDFYRAVYYFLKKVVCLEGSFGSEKILKIFIIITIKDYNPESEEGVLYRESQVRRRRKQQQRLAAIA
jgi:hypothetical protein